jgi:hypothetical protein
VVVESFSASQHQSQQQQEFLRRVVDDHEDDWFPLFLLLGNYKSWGHMEYEK